MEFFVKSPPDKKITMSFALSIGLKAKIKALAAHETARIGRFVSESEFIRVAIEQFIADHFHDVKVDQPRRERKSRK